MSDENFVRVPAVPSVRNWPDPALTSIEHIQQVVYAHSVISLSRGSKNPTIDDVEWADLESLAAGLHVNDLAKFGLWLDGTARFFNAIAQRRDFRPWIENAIRIGRHLDPSYDPPALVQPLDRHQATLELKAIRARLRVPADRWRNSPLQGKLVLKWLRTMFVKGLKHVSRKEENSIALVHVPYDEFLDFLNSIKVDAPIAIPEYVTLGWICAPEEESTANRQCTRSFYVTPKVMQSDAADLLAAAPTDAKTTGTAPKAPDSPESPTIAPNEGGNPPADPFVPLTSWSDIFAALNEPHGKATWKNNETTREKIRKLNIMHAGPIKLPAGRGKQPSVDKAKLLQWWNGLQEHFDARIEEAAAKESSTRSTVASHKYGASGEVVPNIGGSVRRKKGKERKT